MFGFFLQILFIIDTSVFQFALIFPLSKDLRIQHQSLIHEGDLIISGNESLTLEDCVYKLIGNLIVKDNATLFIKNAIFNQTCPDSSLANVIIKDMGTLVLNCSSMVIFQHETARIFVQDYAKFYAISSIIENPIYDVSLWAVNKSEIYMKNSIMKCAEKSVTRACVVLVDHYSNVKVENLTFDRLTAYANATIFIERSTIEDAIRAFNSPMIQVSCSTIRYITADENVTLNVQNSKVELGVRVGGNSRIWFIHSTVPQVNAGGNARVWLISSSTEALNEEDTAEIYVGWDIPLIGPVVFNYKWAPIIHLAIIVLIVAIMLVASYLIMKRLRRQNMSIRSQKKSFL